MSFHEPFGHWQFDFRPLKVGNRPDPNVCSGSATHCWKALKESYKFSLDLIPIGGLSKELWSRKVLKVQIGTISRFLLGSPGIKRHSDVGATERHKEYYMREGGGFPRVRAVVSHVSSCCPWLFPTPRMFSNVKMQDRVTKYVVPLPSLILKLSSRPSHPL
jgi:hypothetical protein